MKKLALIAATALFMASTPAAFALEPATNNAQDVQTKSNKGERVNNLTTGAANNPTVGESKILKQHPKETLRKADAKANRVKQQKEQSMTPPPLGKERTGNSQGNTSGSPL